MNTYTAHYEPGDDGSPLAPAVEMIESNIARRYKEAGPITERDAATIANLTVASLVTCGSTLSVMATGREIHQDALRQLLEQLTKNLAAITQAVGVDEKTYMGASMRMYRDAWTAARTGK